MVSRDAIIETRDIFSQFVWPIWRESLGSNELISVEGSERAFELRADVGGIDGFYAKRSNGIIIPIASRIEFAKTANLEIARGLRPRFTIRCSKQDWLGWHGNTELKRLLSAWQDTVERRYLPYRTFQTFVKKRPVGIEVLFSSSVCTLELCRYVQSLIDTGGADRQVTKEGDAIFMRLYVHDMLNAGVKVTTYHSGDAHLPRA